MHEVQLDISSHDHFFHCQQHSRNYCYEETRNDGANVEHQKGYAITEEQGGRMLDHPLHQPIRSKGCDMRVFFFFQLQIISPCSRRCATCW